MALFRYLRPIDSHALDPHGSLSNTVPRGVIEEVNKELKKVETKRGQYLSFTVEKAKVAKYGSSNGVFFVVFFSIG